MQCLSRISGLTGQINSLSFSSQLSKFNSGDLDEANMFSLDDIAPLRGLKILTCQMEQNCLRSYRSPQLKTIH